MAAKNLPARPAYESLISSLSVLREVNPGSGLMVYLKGEFIDRLIEEADYADVFNRISLGSEIFLPKSPARAERAPETPAPKAADPFVVTKHSGPEEAVPLAPRCESPEEHRESPRVQIEFATETGAAEAHAARQAIRAARKEVYPPPIAPKEPSRARLPGGLKARLVAALRAAARALDAGDEEPSA